MTNRLTSCFVFRMVLCEFVSEENKKDIRIRFIKIGRRDFDRNHLHGDVLDQIELIRRVADIVRMCCARWREKRWKRGRSNIVTRELIDLFHENWMSVELDEWILRQYLTMADESLLDADDESALSDRSIHNVE